MYSDKAQSTPHTVGSTKTYSDRISSTSLSSERAGGLETGVSRDSARRSHSTLHKGMDPKLAMPMVKNLERIFSDENIARAAAGDPNAVYQINKYSSGTGVKIIEKLDPFLPQELKQQIQKARSNSIIAANEKRETSQIGNNLNPTSTFFNEFFTGTGLAFLALHTGIQRLPIKIATSVLGVCFNLFGAAFDILKGVYTGVSDTIIDGQKNGFISGVLTGLGKLENSFFGLRALSEESKNLMIARQDAEEANAQVKKTREITDKLKKSRVYKPSDEAILNNSQYKEDLANALFDNQFNKTADCAGDTSLKTVTSAFVIGKGATEIITKGGSKIVEFGPITVGGPSGIITMARDILSTALDKLERLPVIGAPIVESIESLGTLCTNLANIPAISRVLNFFKDLTNFESIIPTFKNINSWFANPAAFCANKLAAALGLGKLFWTPIAAASKLSQILGLCISVPTFAIQSALACYAGILKYAIVKPTIAAFKIAPAATYSGYVESGKATGILPKFDPSDITPANPITIDNTEVKSEKKPSNEPSTDTAKSIESDVGTPSDATLDRSKAEISSSNLNAIFPVINGDLVLGASRNSSQLTESEKYKDAVKDVQIKLKLWAQNSSNSKAKALAEKIIDNGQYDEVTKQLVMELQRTHGLDNDANLINDTSERDAQGLVVDGIVGPRTSRVLNFIVNQDVILTKNEFANKTDSKWQRQNGVEAADGYTST